MRFNESVEMYLETIYLIEEQHGHAHGVAIAENLGVSKASVSKAMNQLKSLELVNKESYGAVTLTDYGKVVAIKIYKRHQSITKFLVESLGLSQEEASENACKMEHCVSDEMLLAIDRYLGFEENSILGGQHE